MNVHLITFAGGNHYYLAAGDRLCQQAKETNWFKSSNLYDLSSIKNADPHWFDLHYDFIINNNRGYGYWIWKPKLILESLLRLPENDILVYLDSGCELNKLGEKAFALYLEIANSNDMLAFRTASNYPYDSLKSWSKRYLFKYYEREYHYIINEDTHMIESGIQFIKNNSKSRGFIKKWAEAVVDDNYNLVNDSNQNLIECTDFREHRHDQSIFTILRTKENIGSILDNDNYKPHLWNMNLFDIQSPIVAFRNISRVSKLATMTPSFQFGNSLTKIIL